MTVCVAAICGKRQAIVAASDRMLSAHFLAIEFDHPDAKIDILAKTCVGLSAGDALPTTELFAASAGIAQTLQNPQVEMIADRVKRKYSDLRRKEIEEQIFLPRGITVEEFYQQGLISRLPPEVAMALDDRVQRANYGVELIIAGVDASGAHIYGIRDPGVASCYDRVGYHAIGSGMSHALLSLVATGQHWQVGINQSVLNVYQAKKQAELAQGVGNATEIRIITPTGIRTISEEELDRLEKIRNDLLAPKTKIVETAIRGLPFEEKSDESADFATQ